MDYSRIHRIREGQRGTRGNRCGSFVWIHVRHDVNCNACSLFSSLLHAIAGDHIFSVQGWHRPTCLAASLHRCNACTQGLLHTKTVDASEPRGLLRSIYPQLSRLKVHPKVQNLFNRCQVVLVAKITSPASSSAPARILDEAFVLRNRGF